jgi:hypothetical protein
MRDYLLRLSVRSWLIVTLLVGLCPAQQADELTAYFPKPPPGEAAASEVVKLIKLIRSGSGPDRVRIRQDLMRLGSDCVPRLIEELESGNHLYSWTAALVLGELHDPRALDPLGRVVSEQSRGDPSNRSTSPRRWSRSE